MLKIWTTRHRKLRGGQRPRLRRSGSARGDSGIPVYPKINLPKYPKIPKIPSNMPKINQSVVYCIPEISTIFIFRKNIPYTRFWKLPYTVYPKTLANPGRGKPSRLNRRGLCRYALAYITCRECHCWFAADVMAAMLVDKKKCIFFRWVYWTLLSCKFCEKTFYCFVRPTPPLCDVVASQEYAQTAWTSEQRFSNHVKA